MDTPSPLSRRGLLRYTAAASALSALNAARAFAADPAAKPEPGKPADPAPKPADEKPTTDKPTRSDFRIGLVGCGGQGTGDAKDAQRFGKVVAVCDVDESHLAKAQKTFAGAKPFKDFRKLMEEKDVEVVICGTVDHWHTLVSMAAMRAGKDVYCEKPLTLCIDEGKRLVKTQKETGRVLQTGTQQRSDVYFQRAVERIHAGRIGKLKHIDVWVPAGKREGPFKPAPVPPEFDWDLWQGQIAPVEYVKERGHVNFRYWWDYSGGTITDWGAHHNDIALWATGFDRSGPVSAEGKALVEMIPGGFTANSEYEIHFTYPNGLTHTCYSTKDSTPFGGTVNAKGKVHGIKFHGTDGWIWVTRGNIDASDKDIIRQDPKAPRQIFDHRGNFFRSVETRQPPRCDVEIGHRSATMCHLGVAAVRLGRKLNWDPSKEEYVGDAEAQKTVAREMRKPYDYSYIGA
ncbi:MAG: Gfo/Idh/MocA family protein [Phycisphaerae bacterium]|nr:Gfo/Idh/MocA family oxidoreductase [Tepidisphaeraceae bacterium]